MAEIELPAAGEPWRAAMGRRAVSARGMFARHPWAIGLMESRTQPGPVALGYYDAVLGCLRGAGFSVALAAHAFSVLDSYIYGFAVQHSKTPLESPEQTAEVTASIVDALPPADFPHVREMATDHVLRPGYDFGAEFEWGLELILDGLERALVAESKAR